MDPRIIFQELVDDPRRFEDGVDQVVLKLISGVTLNELADSERALLDRATIDLVQAKRKPHEPPVRPAVPTPEPEPRELAWSDDGKHAPVIPDLPQAAPTFWWEKVRTAADPKR